MKKKQTKKVFNYTKLFPLILIIATLFIGIGYAAINSISFEISGEVAAVSQTGVFITEVVQTNQVNANVDSCLINQYYQTMLNSSVDLSTYDVNSSITYRVTVFNKSDERVVFLGAQYIDRDNFYTNPDIEFEISGISVGDTLEVNNYVQFYITFKYKSGVYVSIENHILNSYINFNFASQYNVVYRGIYNNHYPLKAYHGEEFNLTFTRSIPEHLEITMNGRVLTEGVDYTYNNGVLHIARVNGDLIIDNKINTLADTIMLSNQVSNGCPQKHGNTKYYEIVGDEQTSMFCEADDDQGESYYFRGNSTNNYVTFAGLKWRIVRINGDGSVRIVTDTPVGETNYNSYNFNSRTNTNIGYMTSGISEIDYLTAHNNTSNSVLKQKIDAWYVNNILGQYDEYIYRGGSFCNDRTIYNNNYGELDLFYSSLGSYKVAGYGTDTARGYGSNFTLYGSWYRLVQLTEDAPENVSGIQYPTYSCYNKKDRFTTTDNTDYGNGKLTYPVATLTADELVFAGVSYSAKTTNSLNALHNGTDFWTLSPSYAGGPQSAMCAYKGIGSSSYGSGWVFCAKDITSTGSIRPVLNIKANVSVIQGSGTSTDPYVISNTINNDADIDAKIQTMTLDQKIGQMIIASASGKGKTASDTFKNELKNNYVGGVIIFGDNVKSYSQLTTFMNNINAAVAETTDIPLFWSVDQEGGRVQRISDSSISDYTITTIPAMSLVGDTGDEDLAYDVGRVIGEELRVFGFNLDFAPVADVNSNPNNVVIGQRSFGDNASLVSRMAVSLAHGIESTGIITSYKHFPGHGDTATDSHYALPVINKSLEDIQNIELAPFRAAIAGGAKMIMIGHLNFPALDPTYPTSLSRTVITDLLRVQMGFKGVVITDAINMKAITNNYSEAGAIVLAVNAGVDIILCPSSATAAHTAIKNGVQSGQIDVATIDAAVKRILKLKKDFNNNTYGTSYLGSAEHQAVVNRVLNYTGPVGPSLPDYKSNAAEYIMSLSGNGEVFEENGYRYQGANVDNYVKFNNELWRIIGVFGEGVHGISGNNLVKMIRVTSYGSYKYNGGSNGTNWSSTSTYTMLNNTYYSSISVNPMIESNATWLLGGITSAWTNATNIYNLERGTTVYSGNNQTATGKIGLIYISDYLYAAPSSTCDRGTLVHQGNNTYNNKSGCAGNNWMTNNNDMMTIVHRSNAANNTFIIGSGGYVVVNGNTERSLAVYPTIYLKQPVSIVLGSGTVSDPYQLNYVGT